MMTEKVFYELQKKLIDNDNCGQLSKQPDWSYFSLLNKSKIKLIILGLDPYPSGSTGIPFHKETWAEIEGKNHSFDAVIDGLGLKSEIENIMARETPRGFFYKLAENGIAFLNVCYKSCNGKITKKECGCSLKQSLNLNKEILGTAGATIICCGTKVERALRWADKSFFEDLRRTNNMHIPYHPGCYASSRSEKQFTDYWTDGKILKLDTLNCFYKRPLIFF